MGLSLHFYVLDELQQKIFLLENLWQLPLRHYRPATDPTSFLEEISRLFSRAKDEDISPEEFLAFCNESSYPDPETRDKQFEIARCYLEYQKLMRQKDFLDFGDQVALAVHL